MRNVLLFDLVFQNGSIWKYDDAKKLSDMESKGQLISEYRLDVLNFPKKTPKFLSKEMKFIWKNIFILLNLNILLSN